MLRIHQFNLSYPGYAPLACVDWHVAPGERIALLGRSGVGKSTLLRAIVHADQHPEIESRTQQIAYLSQQPALLPWRSVLDNVLLGFHLRGERITPLLRDHAQSLLAQVGLAHFASRRIATLSGGQKARVALARVLCEEATLILLDEPFAGLDRSTRIQMADLCADLLSQHTVILVTHDPRDASDWLDQAMVLSENALHGPYQLDTFTSDRALIDALGVAL